jgi:hypothetical protein
VEPTRDARDSAEPQGYLNECYARSLAEFGTPRPFRLSKGWILERPIAGTSRVDAMGCYPLFACEDWNGLEGDLLDEDATRRLVAVSLVTDPFGGYDEGLLRRCFPDLMVAFKEHFVADLSRDWTASITGHHLRYARRSLSELVVETCPRPEQALDDWVALYDHLVRFRGIRGLAAFSRASFELQLGVPGVVVLRALDRGRVIGMTLWYHQDQVAYYHLGAYSERGYELRASFALFWRAFEELASRGVRLLDLGGGPGLTHDVDDGLVRFKRGWSTESRTAFLCGRIFDREAYASLCERNASEETTYFPAYRAGEFAPNASTADPSDASGLRVSDVHA